MPDDLARKILPRTGGLALERCAHIALVSAGVVGYDAEGVRDVGDGRRRHWRRAQASQSTGG